MRSHDQTVIYRLRQLPRATGSAVPLLRNQSEKRDVSSASAPLRCRLGNRAKLTFGALTRTEWSGAEARDVQPGERTLRSGGFRGQLITKLEIKLCFPRSVVGDYPRLD